MRGKTIVLQDDYALVSASHEAQTIDHQFRDAAIPEMESGGAFRVEVGHLLAFINEDLPFANSDVSVNPDMRVGQCPLLAQAFQNIVQLKRTRMSQNENSGISEHGHSPCKVGCDIRTG